MSQAVAAVHEVREPSAKYLVPPQPELTSPLVQHFNLLATAPGGVARLRELILTLAVQGKLVPQDPNDEPAIELLKKIRAEKDRLIAEGKIKRDKPLAEIDESEKPFELPRGWEWVRLGTVQLFTMVMPLRVSNSLTLVLVLCGLEMFIKVRYLKREWSISQIRWPLILMSSSLLIPATLLSQ
jgi:hypothetical protein